MTTDVKNENLRAALNLALKYLGRYEPPDSRAVSNEFVAMAAVAAGCEDAQCMEIIDAAMKVDLPPLDPPEITIEVISSEDNDGPSF